MTHNLQRMRAMALTALLLTLSLALGNAAAQEDASNDAAVGERGQGAQAEIKGEYEDWIVRCQPAPEDAFGATELCEMYQQVSEQESGQTVLETVIGYPQGVEQPVALFNLPLGMRLPPGVQLQIDDNEPVRFPVQICLRGGCRANIELSERLMEQMRAGAEGVLTIADPQGQGIQLPLSLTGFSAAMADINERRN